MYYPGTIPGVQPVGMPGMPQPNLLAAQAQNLFENYFIIAALVSLTVMVILYKQNPPIVQSQAEEEWLEGDPNKQKIMMVGILAFIFASLGPLISDMLFQSHVLMKFLT